MTSDPPTRKVGTDDTHFLRTEFLERVAHEVRAPAGVTMGALDELELELEALDVEPNSRVAALVAMARRGMRKVLRTADRLARSAELEAGTLVISTTLLDVRSIVATAARDAELTEGRSRITVTTTVPEVPCMVEVEREWMGVAVYELVGNAIRAAKRSVVVAVAHEVGRICVTVSDDRAVRPEPPRARFSPSSPRRDVGLAMALVDDVARLHGSSVEREEHAAPSGGSISGVTVRLRFAAGAVTPGSST